MDNSRSQPKEVWACGQAYEPYVGRWSRLVAREFIAWLGAAPGQVWLDVGAGTGILTAAILQQAAPAKIVATDISPVFIEFARQQVQDARVEFSVADAVAIPVHMPPFDAAVAGLVLNFLPSPQAAVENMTQAVGSGGIVAAYVWDYGGRMEMMRHFWDAAIKIDPPAAELDSGKLFTICHPDALKSTFESAGLQAVEVIPIDIQALFKDFDEYWEPFMAAQGSVSKYLRALADETRDAIRDQLRKQLPIAPDGSIQLIARAWAVKGNR